MKTFVVYTLLALVSFVVNFAVYVISFNSQATPFLHEEQRVDSAILMFKATLPAYAASSIVLAVLFYFAAKRFSD